MSVLGTTNYRECIYYDQDFRSSKTRFVQIAMFEKFMKNWGPNDKAIIFLTSGENGAEKRNWFDNGHKVFGSEERISSLGLKSLIDNMEIQCQVQPVLLKNGDTEEEIWQNFRIIFDCLLPEDEVYFDMTHGFRSLPMLVLVLNNYSKFLKNIKIISITYGNYEARNEKNEAPIINLTSLSELQDWTSAANMFIKTGNTHSITELLNNQNFKSLNIFVDEINECRGLEIYKGESAINLIEELKRIDIHNNSFKELILQIEKKVEKFKSDDVLNGFRAVDFCIQHQLIQQGITLLQEFIVTYILIDIDEIDECDKIDWCSEIDRKVVSGCLSIKKLAAFSQTSNDEEVRIRSLNIAKKVFDLPYKERLTKCVFLGLSHGARNDLNHAGKRYDPKPTGYFADKLKDYFDKTMEILSIKSMI